MPESPYNSLEGGRSGIGLGIFSASPLFVFGDVNAQAAQAYYERAYDTFSKSSEAQEFVAQHGELGWHQMLLEFGLDYLGAAVDDMTVGDVSEFVLEHIPRKVSVDAEAAARIVAELTLFWKFLDRVYQLPAAKSIVEWLQEDGLVARLEAALSDTSNFGMAKSIVALGRRAGYDMTTQEGMAQFREVFNRRMLSAGAPAAAPVPRPPTQWLPTQTQRPQTQHVGRNDPCPCGSGRKFKKCCGNPANRD